MTSNQKQPADFIVRNSAVVLVIIALVLLGMLLTIFKYNSDVGDAGYIIVAALAPVFGYFIWRKTKGAVIRINNRGIFFEGKLVTGWDHFHDAGFDQLPLGLGDPRDKVVLIIYHLSADKKQVLKQQIRYHNTYNRSEEKVLAAIELFSHKMLSKK